MNKQKLMKQIQQFAFAKTEAELFLDTHPESVTALEFYRKTVEELDILKMEYQNNYGPIVAEKSIGETWTWCEGPWPWQSKYYEKTSDEIQEAEN